MSVVLPEDSGPKTSTMRPRGMPPIPSARSSDSAPVGIALTLTCAPGSPMRMTVPLPNSRSICVSAPLRASLRAFAALSAALSVSERAMGTQKPFCARKNSTRYGPDRTETEARTAYCNDSTPLRHNIAQSLRDRADRTSVRARRRARPPSSRMRVRAGRSRTTSQILRCRTAPSSGGSRAVSQAAQRPSETLRADRPLRRSRLAVCDPRHVVVDERRVALRVDRVRAEEARAITGGVQLLEDALALAVAAPGA